MPKRKLKRLSCRRASDAPPPASTHARLGPVLTQRRVTTPSPLRKRKPSSRKLAPLAQSPQPRTQTSTTTSSTKPRALTDAERDAKRKAFLSQPARPLTHQPRRGRNVDQVQFSDDSDDGNAALPSDREGESPKEAACYCLDQFLMVTNQSTTSAESGAQAGGLTHDHSNASMQSATSCETALASYSDESLCHEQMPCKA